MSFNPPLDEQEKTLKMKELSDVKKIIFAVLVGATVGLGLFRWVSPLIGGQCLIICEPYTAALAGAIIGGLLSLALILKRREKRKLLQCEGGSELLKRKKQIRALWIGTVFLFLMAVFPPWEVTTLARDGETTITHAYHYRLLWDPPSVDEELEGASVDGERLLIGWAVVVALAAAALTGAELSPLAKEEEESQTGQPS